MDPAPEPSGPTNDQVAASQTALDVYSGALMKHTTAKIAYDADMSVANATDLQAAATARQAAAMAAHMAIEAGASDAQKEAFGDTAVADAAAAVMSAGGSVTLANAIVVSQGALEAHALTLTAQTEARAAYVAGTSVANATALQTAAAALQAAAMAAHTAIAAGSTDAQKAEFGDTAVAEAATAVAEAATFVIAAQIAADEAVVALEQIQADAVTAATDAATAAAAAKVASEAAKTARENLATLQTGEKSGDLAHASYTQAKAAAAAAKEAQTASDAAAETTDSLEATRNLVAAENARDNAVAAQGMAETQSEAAVAAVEAELMIVGTVKTVGGTDLDADAGASTVTTDGDTVITGLVKSKNPMTTGKGATGVTFAHAEDADVENTERDETKERAYVQAVAERPLTIGKVVDSADDLARLMIVTHYAGSNSVKVYAKADPDPVLATTDDLTGRLGSDGKIQTVGQLTPDDATDNVFVTLKSVNTYYEATEVAGLGTENNLDAMDMVGAKAAAKAVFSYLNLGADGEVGGTGADADTTVYVVLQSTTVTGANTDVVYQHVDITAPAAPSVDEENPATYVEIGVKANIPVATEYKHIHFGAWAALGDPKKDGTQAIDDLGIGFVQSIGDGLTGADMPNSGTANYSGNWVATVQAEDQDGDGDIVLDNGTATLGADFGKGEISALLTGLATLSGDISGNEFSGTKAEKIKHGDLDADGKFTGSFSGGFYGAKAKEAGGIFDFASEDAEAGAFRGAFGGDKD